MTNARIKIIALIVFGTGSTIWWTMLVSKLIYRLYLLGGAPEYPSRFLHGAFFLLPSVALGLLTGVIVLLLSR